MRTVVATHPDFALQLPDQTTHARDELDIDDALFQSLRAGKELALSAEPCSGEADNRSGAVDQPDRGFTFVGAWRGRRAGGLQKRP